ncbi:Tetrathionate hydrolase [Candidatus Hydrogenisulfobacillus filiaventi]|uniref:Tetrathionate hydrolase n=1 Tax=Candidatus Hydrogenisulfobacillus filiaventi TaxID=2707344 RepID=A0A6F8ZJD5_9FIRM|nr:Tetrathionate hydrolase [Candidatus Hydrogenisulfobacillus filiaventi]
MQQRIRRYRGWMGLLALAGLVAGCGGPAAAGTGSAAPGAAAAPPAPLPVEPHGPFARVYDPANLPGARDAAAFPRDWSHAYGNARHNAAFAAPNGAPAWVVQGVSWAFPEARAWPLSEANAFGTRTYGARTALPTQTQFLGNATGVTAVGGVIYAESDDDFAYAINARTGRLIWRYSPVGNHLMGDPVVAHGVVYLSAGSVGFNFAQVQRFAKGEPAIRGGAVSFNGVYALNAQTGRYLWHYGTVGEAMATPAVTGGRLYFATGNGNVHCLDAATGKPLWTTHVGGIDNMSSPAVSGNTVYVALSVPGYLYALNATTGQVEWKVTVPGVVNTGMGDVSPAVSRGVVVMDAIAKTGSTFNTDVFAVSAATGKLLWLHHMGSGPKPPAFKGGVPMIHDGVVYVGSPVNSVYQAYRLRSGRRLWTWQVPDAGPAGAGRGAPTWYRGALYISTGPNVYALNPANGTVLGQEHLGGRFGIVDPVIVGGTAYLGNSWDWVQATPLSRINPHYRP